MGFYDLSKQDRLAVVAQIKGNVLEDLKTERVPNILHYFSDEDTYIRKAAYLAVGSIYAERKDLKSKIIIAIEHLSEQEDFRVRQTAVNAAGEIGKSDFTLVQHFFDKALFDGHHAVRNAVIGSVKKMGEKNPHPVLSWAKIYLHHPNKEIRREICHGIELRGRKYPEDILPLLKELQFDKTARVRKTLVHVIGQISYKKGCLEKVLFHLKKWENKELVADALEEIVDVHHRYRNFAALTQEEARAIIQLENLPT